MSPGKQPIEVQALQSKKHVITITVGENSYKVFQISFQDDGSLLVHFPYHTDPNGIASLVTLDPSLVYPAENVSLTKEGKVTSHRIKFSHHPDGNVHFSQTGKVFTRVRKRGVPLRDVNGHIFTVMLQGLEGFEKAVSEKDKHHHSLDRSVVEYKAEPDNLAFKFVALWEPFEEFKERIQFKEGMNKVGPQIVRRLEPTPSLGFLLSPTDNNPMFGYVLTLAIELIPRVDKDNESMIIFIGGFDRVQLVNNLNQTSSFLALLYPARNPEELRSSIGSIDYHPRPALEPLN